MDSKKKVTDSNGKSKAGLVTTASEKGKEKDPAVKTPPRATGGRPPREELAPLQLRAIKALLTQPTMAAAAEEIGVHARTISRWFKERAFRLEYLGEMTELQRELWSEMLAVRNEAWNRFLKLMGSTDERIALRAATWYLDRVLSVPAILSRLAVEDAEPEQEIPSGLRALLEEAEAIDRSAEDGAA